MYLFLNWDLIKIHILRYSNSSTFKMCLKQKLTYAQLL